MRDHTYLGTPVSRMSNEDLDRILADGGVRIISSDGESEEYAQAMAMERLRIERLRRDLGLPLRGSHY